MKTNLFTLLLLSALLALSNCAKQTDASADCPATTCLNGGTVSLTDTVCYCACANSYTGDSCQYSALGSYNALRVNTATTAADNVVVTFTVTSSGLSISIAGATLSGSFTAYNTFSVATQTVGGVVYTGSGTFNPNNVSMNLTQSGVVYRYSGQKQ